MGEISSGASIDDPVAEGVKSRRKEMQVASRCADIVDEATQRAKLVYISIY